MKDLPPLAGWPTQTRFVHELKEAPQKKRAPRTRKKTVKRK
jgi:hypothetical protein